MRHNRTNKVGIQEIDVKTFKEFIAEEKAFQGTFKVKYDELDMKNPAKDAADRVAEDDGPHTYKKAKTPNFTTVVDPATVVNQANSKGNVDVNMSVETQGPGKPMKKLSRATKKNALHPEDLTGAVAGVAIGESCRTKTIYVKKKLVSEGSARGSYTRRGEYAKSREMHLKQADTSEKSRGVEQNPTADARSYSRTHTTPYNKGSAEYEADKKRGESLRRPKHKKAVPLQVNPENVPDRIKDILNHPHYKNLGKKQ